MACEASPFDASSSLLFVSAFFPLGFIELLIAWSSDIPHLAFGSSSLSWFQLRHLSSPQPVQRLTGVVGGPFDSQIPLQPTLPIHMTLLCQDLGFSVSLTLHLLQYLAQALAHRTGLRNTF